LRQSAVDWTRVDGGMTVDLFGVAVTGTAAWVVGDAGAAYRLRGSAWSTTPTGTHATLRAVVAPTPDTAIAAGDAGTLLRWAGGPWTAVDAGTSGPLRSAALIGGATWVVGDRGTAIELLGDAVRHVDLGTTCTLRAVFPEGASVWIVGSDGVRGEAWRIAPNGTEHWGTC
ncbi:MAG: hypothetical protein KGQ88_11610, partial [Chloroflexi bacterium]|nr:hypothetical protein [Chloroflexota bacterium]